MKLWKAPLAALMAAGMLLSGATVSLAGGQQHQTGRPGIPWRNVGPGWVLTQYTAAVPESGHGGPQTLYLISPGGSRYRLAWWPNSQNAPQLVAWSPDGARALFQVFTSHPKIEQMTLATGAITTFSLPGDWTPVGYTTPHGRDIVASNVAGQVQELARFDLNGRLVARLGSSVTGQALYTPDGTAFVTATDRGVKLVSNSGSLIRQLPVPHTAARSCNAARWWNAGTVLVSCGQPNAAATRLWLVPVSGRQPTALTPPRGPTSQDLGDIGAWQLRSGLYLQGAGPCGVLYIFRQAANGAISLVHVPHTIGDDAHVLTASGSRLLVQAPTSCTGSNSLFWFNPAGGAEQWLVRAPGNVQGVTMAIPFYSRENAF
ncbi:MAG TPA: hypothetical protein VKU39_09880 [Streptosporangiaceae bacterium]|nr:hypothetical protein [Streptosporangiaceae bacterium]